MNGTNKVSLSFSKKIEKKNLTSSALANSVDKLKPNQSYKENITSFDKDKIITSRPEEHLIIPLIVSKREGLFKKLKNPDNIIQDENNTKSHEEMKLMNLDEQAAAELIEESKRRNNEYLKPESDLSTIQMNLDNNFDPKGLIDVGSTSTMEDYETVAVESYGAALLRGMGWKKDTGVGKNNRKVVNIVEPTNRALGLTKEEKDILEMKKNGEEETEELKKGCYAFIQSGRNKGIYGTVQTIDEDYLLIKPSRGDKVIREVELNIRVVSAKEFKEFSRVINKDMYDQYKAEETQKKEDRRKELENKKRPKDLDKRKDRKERTEEEHDRPRDRKERTEEELNKRHAKKEWKPDTERHLDVRENRDKDERRKISKHETNFSSKRKEEYSSTERNSNVDYYSSKERSSLLHEKYGSNSKNKNNLTESRGTNNKFSQSYMKSNAHWVTENLKVRIIDKKYKEGKYHKQKVIVCSVDTVESCSCVTEDGKMLWDVNLSYLETVIPKTNSSLVLILNGPYKGQKGKILELNKEKEKATIQLLTNSSVITKLLYDDICEFVKR